MIAEGFEANDRFLNQIRDQGSVAAAADEALQARLKDDGAAKIAAGITTSAEVLRALSG